MALPIRGVQKQAQHTALAGDQAEDLRNCSANIFSQNDSGFAAIVNTPTKESMLCLLVPSLPEGEEWSYEIKFDGYRALAEVSNGEAKLISRNSKPLPFPEVAEAVKRLKCKSAVVDGEVVALDAEGKMSFSLLQNHRSKARALRYMLFDLLELDGKDWRKKPLEERRRKLEKIIPADDDVLGFSRSLNGTAEELMNGAQATGLEGIIAKRLGSQYQPGERTGFWSKWKADQVETFIVGGYTRNGEVIVGKKEKQGLRYVAKVKAGFVPRTRKELLGKLLPLKSDLCPFFNLPEKGKGRFGEAMTAEKMEECQWVRPEMKILVGFVEWTEAQHLRHSKFMGILKCVS